MLVVFLAIELARRAVLGNVYPAASGHHFAFGPAIFTTPSFFNNLFLVQGLPFHPPVTWNVPAWSISCEAAVYLIFPASFLALVRYGRNMLWLAAFLAATTLTVLYYCSEPHSLNSEAGYNVVRCAGEFTVGLCLYRLYSGHSLPIILARDNVAWPVVALLILSLHFGLPDLLLVAELALLLLVAVMNRGLVRAALEMRIPEFLGRISYSVYMVHWPVFFLVALAARVFGGPDALLRQSAAVRGVLFIFACMAVIACSTLTYCAIEVPCRKVIMAWRKAAYPSAPSISGVEHEKVLESPIALSGSKT